MIHPIVMAGGRGERFWPYSNSEHPKQLLPLVTRKTMLEDTLDNLRKFKRNAKVRLVIGKNLEQPVKKLLGKKPGVEVVAEPMGRNTAAAVALACRLIQREDPQGVMLVLTADHAIAPPEKFARAMQAASALAGEGTSLVTFGIRPDRPEVGFGYIETDGGGRKAEGLDSFAVKRFVEKPDRATAQEYVDSGRFFWNSGMFAWRVDYLWEQFRKHQPEIARIFEAAGELNSKSPAFAGKLRKIYKTVPEISIDNGIMEKADRIRVVIPQFSWDDIGSWSALDRLHKPDAAGNRLVGQCLSLEASNNTLFSENGLVAAFGVSDLLIVQTGGVTLVLPKDQAPRLKEMVKLAQKNAKLKKYL
ncbi:MAG TPA: sugar phosphate nucleotidyltransferase [Fibrobacteria bacterium]|nr:sugar phosphate nucleotidyltransferase [Fibrobacteria bacterium]